MITAVHFHHCFPPFDNGGPGEPVQESTQSHTRDPRAVLTAFGNHAVCALQEAVRAGASVPG